MSTLEQLAGVGEITERIGDQEYHFSELTLASKARLNAWLRQNTPDPMESVKAGLEGLPPEDRQYLLNEARKERLAWPPDVSTPRGIKALMDSTPGGMEVFFETLQTHHPEITREGAFRIFRTLEKDPDVEQKSMRILFTSLHLPMPKKKDSNVPKTLEPPSSNGHLTGSSSTADVNANSE